MHAATAESFDSTRREPAVRQLDDLLDLGPDELERLYASARVPTIESVTGDLKGRMLAWVPLPPSIERFTRALGRWDRFPWRGKSFRAGANGEGEGINRVVSNKLRLFRFTTKIERSFGGDFDAIRLDYDHPENPRVIRMIKDEIRELSPGLYLGQAYLMARGRPRLVLYFGLSK